MRPYLSIIIPVHNEAARLANCLETVIPFLCDHHRHAHEIIIVDNGSTDDTFKIARSYANWQPEIYALSLGVKGKGIAVRNGMLFARGRYRYMCDVDLSTPIDALSEFLEMARFFDVVVGSRTHVLSQVETSIKRKVIGRVFHALVGSLAGGITDTQCGFKLFAAPAARAIFGRMQLTGFAFDVEALYLARLLGYTIAEVPVTWKLDPDSRVRLVRDSLGMALDVISLPWRHMPIPAADAPQTKKKVTG